MHTLRFPENFMFGTATSAFQVEGNDGTRISDWDEYLMRRKNEIIRPGEVGAQWWKKGNAENDLKRVQKLGMNVQRIGIEWARIEPECGVIDRQAIARYKEIIGELKNLGLAPMVTLSHYVLPKWVADQGGWKNRKTVTDFLHHVSRMVHEFPEVQHWLVINEPSVLLTFGYIIGHFPPFDRNLFTFFKARENLINAMRDTYSYIKSVSPDSQVGNAFSFSWMRPHAHDSRLELMLTSVSNYLLNTNYIDATKNHTDFIGINYYTGFYIEFHPSHLSFSVHKDASAMRASLPLSIAIRPHAFLSDWGWPIVPDFFLHLLVTMKNRYGKPLIITENGVADREDTFRPFYILTHLTAMWKAIKLGADVRGYLHWASIDNLEWNEGFQKRFGLVYVNQATGERKLRKSGELLSHIAKNGHIDLEECIEKFVPKAQQTIARSVIDQLLHDPRGHHVRCQYR